MNFEWWQILIIMGSGVLISGLLMLVAVFLGGILVFKTRTITMPTPFFNESRQKSGDSATSYVSELYQNEIPDILDESLSPAAARLREQKEVVDLDDHRSIMDKVRGKK